MTYVKTKDDGRIEAVYHGLQKDVDVWNDVNSDLLDETGNLYLISEADEPNDRWDSEDGVIGVVRE